MNATPEPYAVLLLKRDHRIIDELFTELGSAAPQQQAPLTQRVSKLLAIHARIEERYLYPLAREVLGDDAVVATAERAHERQAKLLDKIGAADGAPKKALLLELSEDVRAHVHEEEHVLLPRLLSAGTDLGPLARELENYKDILMQEEGLHEDDELNVRPAR